MRGAARTLSMLIVFSMCLTMCAYASGGPDVPETDAGTAPPAHASGTDTGSAVLPDPEPPSDEDEAGPDVTDAGTLEPSAHATLTGCPALEDDGPITLGAEVQDRQDIALDEAVEGAGYTAVYAAGSQADAHVTGRAVLSAAEGAARFPTGRGTALVAHDGAKMTVEDAQITVSGAARAGLTLSDGTCVTLRDSQITALGGDPLGDNGEGYVNPADDAIPGAPPWGLGINGSSRTVGLIGLAPSLSLVGSVIAADGWSALTAGGENAVVTAVDTSLDILPQRDGGLGSGWNVLGLSRGGYGSGCGTYLAGGASQYFYGVHVTGATYGAILNGTDRVYFGPSDGTILLYDGDRLAGSVPGQGQASHIQGVFGLLVNGDIAGGVTVEGRTSIETADAVVLYKNGSGELAFNNARLHTDSGVLLQMMDDDNDGRIGLLSGGYGYSPVYDERDAGGPGFPGLSDGGQSPGGDEEEEPSSPDSAPPAEQPQQLSVSYANGLYTGDIYNGTGYYGQPGDSLSVNVGRGAVLDGDISLTSAVKALPYSAGTVKALRSLGDDVRYVFLDGDGQPCQEEQAVYIQLLRYTIGQYYLQGHVQDLPFYNGQAAAAVTVAEGGAWAVQDTSIVTQLTVAEGALVYGAVTDNGDGSLTLRPAGEPLEPGTYVSDPDAVQAAMAGTDAAEPAQDDGKDQITITVGGREYTLDLHTVDGVEYIRLSDLVLLFFGGIRSPSI